MLRSLTSGEVIDRRWTRFSFPTTWHYDLLRGLDCLRSVGVEPHERVAEGGRTGEEETAPERAVAAQRPSPRSGRSGPSTWKPESARPAAGTSSAPFACLDWYGIELPKQ